jgi:hypothetical protein
VEFFEAGLDRDCVGSVAGFFEGFFDVLVEGPIFGKGDAEVADVLKFGDGLVVE